LANNEYSIRSATLDDIPQIMTLQEANLPANGGSLSVRQPTDWFARAIVEDAVVVALRTRIVGYVLGTSIAAQAHIPVIKSLLGAYPPPPECYVYGPVCVAESERGKGLAAALFEVLRERMNDRPALTFVRTENTPSLQAHRKMGMRELGVFLYDGVSYVAFFYQNSKDG
jgi:GNAT superfamily N-acetyltransferase